MKDTKQREQKIILFIKEKLKSRPNWFLIYDNVERFSEIQNYFPCDPNVWGKGKIILTTRDSTIQSNSYINNTIQIGELTTQDRLSLFTKIISNGNVSQFTAAQKEDAKKFLINIPPFPLDVSIAAYYIKMTNISYVKYLGYLNEYNKDFATLQESILKGASEYTKTRYNIISLSLKRLIDTHKDFKDLLLFMSLLDSQNIPRALLDSYKKDVLVDNFIYSLKKYSLITNEASIFSQSLPTISIHRSTQEMSLAYLTKILKLQKNNKLLQSITTILVKYIADVREEENYPKMRLLANHSEVFLSHNTLVNAVMRGCIAGELGHVYYYLGNQIKARQLLEQSLAELNKHDSGNYSRIAKTLLNLGIVDTEAGNYTSGKDLLERSLLIYKKYFPENHYFVARTSAYLGNVEGYLGNYEKAKDLLEQALLIYKKHFPENHDKIAWVSTHLGNVYRELGNYEKAKNLLEQSFIIYKKYLSENHVRVAWVALRLGNVYKSLGNYEKAKSFLEKSLTIYEKNYGKTHLKVARVLTSLGQVYLLEGHVETTENLFRRALEIFQQNKHSEGYICLESLAELHMKKSTQAMTKGDTKQSQTFKKQAVDSLKQALKIVRAHFPENSPHIVRIKSKLKDLTVG